MKTSRIMGGAAATLALALATSGCGLASMDASTSCGDFLHATLADQDAAVSKVASDLKAGNAVTPLGRPNISYLCANDPDMTLGDAVRHTG